MEAKYTAIVRATSYKEGLAKAEQEARYFFDGDSFELDDVSGTRDTTPVFVKHAGAAAYTGPTFHMTFDFVGAVGEPEPEPVDAELGTCPRSGEACREACQALCGDNVTPEFRVGDVVRIIDQDPYNEGREDDLYPDWVGRTDTVEEVNPNHWGKPGFVDLADAGIWRVEGLELVRRAS